MTTQNLGLRISILSGSSAAYIETHNVTTNNFGLYTLSVGGGVPVSGTINSVNWSSGINTSKWRLTQMEVLIILI